jgi:hypothetical protein
MRKYQEFFDDIDFNGKDFQKFSKQLIIEVNAMEIVESVNEHQEEFLLEISK